MADAETIIDVLGRSRFRSATEDELQRGIALALAQAGVEADREVVIAPGCRIDFLVGRVGVEAKIKGSTPDVRRQLDRYLASDLIDDLVLVTTRARHLAIVHPHVRVVVAGLWQAL